MQIQAAEAPCARNGPCSIALDSMIIFASATCAGQVIANAITEQQARRPRCHPPRDAAAGGVRCAGVYGAAQKCSRSVTDPRLIQTVEDPLERTHVHAGLLLRLAADRRLQGRRRRAGRRGLRARPSRWPLT